MSKYPIKLEGTEDCVVGDVVTFNYYDSKNLSYVIFFNEDGRKDYCRTVDKCHSFNHGWSFDYLDGRKNITLIGHTDKLDNVSGFKNVKPIIKEVLKDYYN